MSRIGKRPIEIPSGVKVSYVTPILKVEGPKGSLLREIMSDIALEIEEKSVSVNRADDAIKSRSAHGLTRTLINNMVVGVTKGFEKILEINGVGYRAEAKGDVLSLSLGYSHPINFPLPKGITVEVDKMTKVFVRGIDKELVGQTAAKIRSFRGPEPYKGKGIKYADERILRKAGKTGKK
ncbi:ribosomal protein L6 [Geobacter metallireducens RCH3]|uniref:Large ribosomal subunit protein uL6 n=1 Tax=Geobacter metallireducens (strain ATCC 53774 / DSM 7210 / GS-15) TaxID=269799 RepID=RL6_GEOMG|nr:50S ribosomal protein L6 [Geobacter metallireducens]Q39XZ1.1 RecName: Full=Large ribosomal subunit protein uL6; AltName: Full=50S ribosomal protein L6 [Geobacter metallireducens GS-15]ABB30883.1 ribosomal protein L6 [Geobacter metallireducens GS-15]EHP84780.1 ribosomal protein L6 [Geobacter metallireducens RCH3]